MSPELCQNCGKRPATTEWCGEGGLLAFTHGLSKRWCEVCALTEQLRYARASAAAIPELRRRLEEALGE